MTFRIVKFLVDNGSDVGLQAILRVLNAIAGGCSADRGVLSDAEGGESWFSAAFRTSRLILLPKPDGQLSAPLSSSADSSGSAPAAATARTFSGLPTIAAPRAAAARLCASGVPLESNSATSSLTGRLGNWAAHVRRCNWAAHVRRCNWVAHVRRCNWGSREWIPAAAQAPHARVCSCRRAACLVRQSPLNVKARHACLARPR